MVTIKAACWKLWVGHTSMLRGPLYPPVVYLEAADLPLLRFKKGECFPYSLPSVGPGSDPGVQVVSPQVTISHSPGVGCHYFPPGLRLPSQPQSITTPWPIPSYTAWWQRQIGVNNLPKVVMQLCPEYRNWTHDLLWAIPPCQQNQSG